MRATIIAQPAFAVSLQTVATSVHALVTGLSQVKAEVETCKGMNPSPEDHFVKVMEVGEAQVLRGLHSRQAYSLSPNKLAQASMHSRR
jgi:hypothetical protein